MSAFMNKVKQESNTALSISKLTFWVTHVQTLAQLALQMYRKMFAMFNLHTLVDKNLGKNEIFINFIFYYFQIKVYHQQQAMTNKVSRNLRIPYREKKA